MRSSVVTLALCACSLGGPVLDAQEPRNWGAQWRERSFQDHVMYVAGFQEGYIVGSVLVQLLVGELAPEGDIEGDRVRALSLTPEQKKSLKVIGEARDRRYEVERFGTEAVVRVLDDLYSDPSNTFIPWIEMVSVAILRLRGEPDERIQRMLALLRSVSAGRDEE